MTDLEKIKKPFVRSPYNYNGNKVSFQTGLVCDEPTMAQQQFKDDADINTILRRFNVTGEIMAPVRQPTFGDFYGVSDYKEALDLINDADRSFSELPASLRDRFQNDPSQLLDFLGNPDNRSEAIDLGLIPPPARPDFGVPTPNEQDSAPAPTAVQQPLSTVTPT